eukprot:1387333-Karenia_brevis.AAC.1
MVCLTSGGGCMCQLLGPLWSAHWGSYDQHGGQKATGCAPWATGPHVEPSALVLLNHQLTMQHN